MNIQSFFDAIESHALTLGQFEKVNTHEPKNAPGNRLSAAIWVQHIGPEPGGSGLASTNVRIEFNLRIYSNMIAEPQDAIDPEILTAVDVLLNAYTGDFTLGGTIQSVDLLGKGGTPLQAQAGYINQDGEMMRVMTVTLPVIVNDAWVQAA